MRMKRLKGAGAAHYHCMSRIVAGEHLLGDGEKEVLRGMIWQVADFCGVQVVTYAVMSNHFHVLVYVPNRDRVEISDRELVRRYGELYKRNRPAWMPTVDVLAGILKAGGGEAEDWRRQLKARMHDVSEFMKALKQRFTVWYNKSHERYGTLWSDRFKSVLVEAEPRALATVAAYIDLNPVRAGLVEDPATYRWSGYAEAMAGTIRARKGLGAAYGKTICEWKIVCTDYRMVLFGKGSMAVSAGRKIDRNEALKVINSGGKVPLTHALRCRVRYFTDGAVLGSSEFVRDWFEVHQEKLRPKRKTDPRPMAGANWDGLTVYRGLRRKVFE